MAQRLKCPMCGKILIKNEDLVVSEPVVFDLERIKTTKKPIQVIVCHNCKRRIRYFIDN